MRFLLAFLFFGMLRAGATTYYVSNNGSSSGNGTSQTTSWSFTRLQAELSKKGASVILPGDFILLKRGDVFHGALTFGSSGTMGHPITLGAYGTGAKPVITGFATVTQWSSLGGHLFESTQSISVLPSCNMVTINGRQYGQGRFPNENTPNKGYLKVDQVSPENTSFSGAGLSAAANWTGARVVIRPAHYILDTSTIYSQEGNTITVSKMDHKPPKGYGYFITNDARTLDKHGEWYYNPQTRKFRIYLDASPAQYTIKVAVLDTLINCDGRSYITIQDIRLEGANRFGTFHRNSPNNTVKGCEIVWCGDEGISAADADNRHLSVLDNYISDCGDYGVMARFVKSGLDIQRNTVRRIGIFEQNGGYGTICRIGISLAGGGGHEIAYNRTDSTGYIGIRFSGSNVNVHHNFVQNYDFVLDDGGGIHTGNAVQAKQTNRKVWRNIVINGIGATAGTGGVNQSCGFYIDDASHEVELWENVAAYGGDAGIYLHNNWNINAHDNLVFDFKDAAAQIVHDKEKWGVPYGIAFTNNILVAKDPKAWTLKFLDLRDSASMLTVVQPNGPAVAGMRYNINSNIYARPLNDSDPKIYVGWYIYQKGLQQLRSYTLPQFSARFNFDKDSKGSVVNFPGGTRPEEAMQFFYNPNMRDSVIILRRTWKGVDGKVYPPGPLKLEPFTGIVLLKGDGAAGPRSRTGMIHQEMQQHESLFAFTGLTMGWLNVLLQLIV